MLFTFDILYNVYQRSAKSNTYSSVLQSLLEYTRIITRKYSNYYSSIFQSVLEYTPIISRVYSNPYITRDLVLTRFVSL